MSKIQQLHTEIDNFVIDSVEKLEQYRLQFLSKKSELQSLLSDIKNIAPEERKQYGILVNELKQKAQNIYDQSKEKLESSVSYSVGLTDVTSSAKGIELGG